MRSAVIVLGVGLSIVVASCASAPATPATPSSAPTAAAKAAPVPADIARAGVITVGIPANPNLTTGKDANGLPQGVAPDLINALATRMGVKLVWADLTDGAKAVQNIQSGAWDIALASPDAAGTESLAFVGYLEIDHTLLVPGTSAIRSFADADKPGLKIWVQRGAPVERTLTRAVKSATIVLKEPWLTVAAFQGVALRLIPSPEGGPNTVAVSLEHRDAALSVPLYSAEHTNDVVAEWQLWARVFGLPLLVADPAGSLREPFRRLGGVRVGTPAPRRRRRNVIKARRPSFLLRRRPGIMPELPLIHRGEREIIARN